MKRFDVAGRKVIFYIEDMNPGDSISFSFQARALYPVRAKGVASQAIRHHNPDWRGETLGSAISVSGDGGRQRFGEPPLHAPARTAPTWPLGQPGC